MGLIGTEQSKSFMYLLVNYKLRWSFDILLNKKKNNLCYVIDKKRDYSLRYHYMAIAYYPNGKTEVDFFRRSKGCTSYGSIKVMDIGLYGPTTPFWNQPVRRILKHN